MRNLLLAALLGFVALSGAAYAASCCEGGAACCDEPMPCCED